LFTNSLSLLGDNVITEEVFLGILLFRSFELIFEKTTPMPCSIMTTDLILSELNYSVGTFGIPKHCLETTAQNIANDIDLLFTSKSVNFVDLTTVDLVHGLDHFLL
jgi:hypothetical protein